MQTVYPCFGCIPGPVIVPLEDTVTARRDGYYKLYFSNSRAWWHTLTINYLFQIENS